MKYIRTKDGRIYDLESKEVSSWEYIDKELANKVYKEKEAFYCIYYYDEYKAPYLETDGKGGQSMDSIRESEILKQADTIEELCDYIVVINPDKNFEYMNLKFINFDKLKEKILKNKSLIELPHAFNGNYQNYSNTKLAILTEYDIKFVADIVKDDNKIKVILREGKND